MATTSQFNERTTRIVKPERVGILSDLGREARDSAISNLEDMDVRPADRRERVQAVSTRLQAAKDFGKKLHEELRTLCQGLEERLQEIGYSISTAHQFQGSEKLWATLGYLSKSAMDRAQVSRLRRLEHQDVDELVKEINELTLETVRELGYVEKAYTEDGAEYNTALNYVVKKLKESQPKLQEAREKRQEFEEKLKVLKLELEAGTVSETERPAKEEELEQLQRSYQNTLLQETDYLEIFNNAQRAMEVLKDNRDSTQQGVISIHQMRRGLLEKQQNLKTVLERSMTAVRARAKLERYKDIDPAFNKTVELLTEHNIKVAGAAVEVALERASKAAIDPEKSAELSSQLLESVTEFLEGMAKLEEEARRGPYVPAPRKDETEGNSLDS